MLLINTQRHTVSRFLSCEEWLTKQSEAYHDKFKPSNGLSTWKILELRGYDEISRIGLRIRIKFLNARDKKTIVHLRTTHTPIRENYFTSTYEISY